jgi:hypothetical protein
LSPASALRSQLVIERYRPIAFSPYGSGTDKNDVRQRSQHLEDALIGGPTKEAGPAVDRDGTIQGRDHVAPHERPISRAGWDRVRLDEVDHLSWSWQE